MFEKNKLLRFRSHDMKWPAEYMELETTASILETFQYVHTYTACTYIQQQRPHTPMYLHGYFV